MSTILLGIKEKNKTYLPKHAKQLHIIWLSDKTCYWFHSNISVLYRSSHFIHGVKSS